VESISTPIVFEKAVWTNYFFEIAKLRALRILFNLLKRIQPRTPCNIIAFPKEIKLYDYNVNMLRTTTECMSYPSLACDAIAIYLMMPCTTKT
jgi:methylmalonyl-CoA mutase